MKGYRILGSFVWAWALLYGSIQAQSVAFHFIENDPNRIEEVTRLISIDSRRDSLYYAFANPQELKAFLSLGYTPFYDTMYHNKAIKASFPMANTIEEMDRFDRYPTYPVYVALMQKWALEYPQICHLDTIGISIKNRLILSMVITDSVLYEDEKPQVFYTSTLHGDETTGYILMLHLIDELLRNYGKDSQITDLVQKTRIFINPMANPDGTYAGGDSNVALATRYNANNVDLNRNYPDVLSPLLEEPQKENLAMMAYASGHHFVMSLNIHGGAEVLNYPWDTYKSKQRFHADYIWWKNICREYIDTCRKVGPNRFTSISASGYVHGGDWYVVYNGRQDYMNRQFKIREQTLEISDIKMLNSSSELTQYWEANKASLLQYIGQVHKGIKGRVKDSITGKPLAALVEVLGRDKDSSAVSSYLPFGCFFRPLEEDLYQIRVSLSGYQADTLEVSLEAQASNYVEVALLPSGYKPDTLAGENRLVQKEETPSLYPNPVGDEINFVMPMGWEIGGVFDRQGSCIIKPKKGPIYVENLPAGLYTVRCVSTQGAIHILKFVKL